MPTERTAPTFAGFVQAARFILFAVPAAMRLRPGRITVDTPA